jgi:hypothetical protein
MRLAVALREVVVAALREAAAAPTKAVVRRAAPREAAGKIRQPNGRRFFLTGARVLRRGVTHLIPRILFLSTDIVQLLPKILFIVSADVIQPIPIIFCIG